MQNPQANPKKKSTKVFWEAVKVINFNLFFNLCSASDLEPRVGNHGLQSLGQREKNVKDSKG